MDYSAPYSNLVTEVSTGCSDMETFSYPEEWSDDQAMDVMFAPFRDRLQYPKAYEQKMKFWSKLIMRKLQYDGNIIISTKHLSHKFKRKDRMPACFNDALIEIVMNKHNGIEKLSEVTAAPSWLSWGYATFIKAPLMWGVGTVLKKPTDIEGEYVVQNILKAKSQAVLDLLQSSVSGTNRSCLIDYNTLQSQVYPSVCHSVGDYDLILFHLSRLQKISMQPSPDGNTLIKFVHKGEEKVTSVQKSDTEVVKIERAAEVLENEIETLTKSVNRFTEDARDYIRRGLKTTAFHTLKKRKRAQKLIDKKYSTLDMLHGLLERVQNTASDKMVLDAYAAGTAVLNTHLRGNDTGVDRVDEILDSLNQAMDDHNELNETLSSYNTSQQESSEVDLQEELDQLLSDDGELDRLVEPFSSLNTPGDSLDLDTLLPDVPNQSPSASPKATTPSTLLAAT